MYVNAYMKYVVNYTIFDVVMFQKVFQQAAITSTIKACQLLMT